QAPAGGPAMPAGHPPTGGTPAPSGGTAAPGGGTAAPGGGGPAPSGQVPAGPLPAGHPTVPPGQQMPGAGTPQGEVPTDEMHRRAQQVMRSPSLASARESGDVPVGTIRVTVVDGDGQPVPDAAVDVGSLAQGERQRWNARTDARGVALFEDMPTGSNQAYRVNVPHGGATYSTQPFRLPMEGDGYEVRVTRLPTTRDDRFVFFHTFSVVIEQRGERMHVIHQTRLSNAGSETYVFPEDGLRVELPEEATAFQFQRVISDQRIEEATGEGEAYVMRGSVPPGTVSLAYAYDIPVGDEDLEIPVQIPFAYSGLQVIAEAIPGLTMAVEGMSGARKLDQRGEPCESAQVDPTCAWVLVDRRQPEQPRVSSLTVRLTGIPGPSPVRWIAVALGLLFVLGGAFFGLRGRARGAERRYSQRAHARRRAALLAEIRELEADYEAGEIGPQFRQKRRDAIVRELAALLREKDAVEPGKAKAGTPRPAR
ncbi:MAG TPA: hypothetical protein RMH99_02965, partial [Sandaracinaceae bacterium LLY-WYZ-13_1]|nr:hypothetical protein [Sandaracinaceae bacterium LLY-WYZ-13_1]